ncbi:alpha/beta-hydrolase [Mollisia scopiformis]|uniref:Alpha/beta-hydrolase n=1 Tax=Mollisia scopiformis TaxID=149040 RepID=A0A194XVH7_MOLSC|nr:alpha/beta-hydrolase [Mollisia scopiformis]KUJ24233.1 alpha/beta-hydrolase [Mollisia scopiformis]
MSTSKPSILFIPGSFALPEFYDVVLDPIKAQGYEIRALHLLTVGLTTGPREGAPPTMYDDAAFIAKEVEKLVDQEKDIILIGHSYGGIPLSQSTKGLGIEERKAQGKKGGIVKLAYMTCLVPDIGQSAMAMLTDVKEEHRVQFRLDERGWFHQNDIPRAASISFSDIPQEEGEAWIRRMPAHSAVSFTNELTYAGYKDIPVSYLICEEDLVIPLRMQRDEIELIEKVSGKKVDVTSIKTGHIPPASQPQKVIDWILSVIAKA